jgi:phage-related protein
MNEQLKVIISAEVEKFKKGVEEAKSKIGNFKEQVAKASKDVDSSISKMGDAMATGLKAGAVAIAAAGAALVGLAASSSEYRAEQAKLVSAFETAGASAETAKGTYNDLFRVLGDGGQATEAAAHLAKLTTNQQDLSEWTNICQGVYATFGDSLPIEGLTEAANETAKVGQVTGGLADALNWAGISEDAFNEKLAACNTEAEREKLIRETLNATYSEAAANYEKNAAQTLAQNEAQLKLQETTAKLGEALAPLITAFTSFGADALAVVTPYIENLAATYMPALQEALDKAAEVLGTIFKAITDNWGVVVTIAGVIGGITAAVGLYNAVAAVKAAMAAAEVTTVWGLVSAYAAHAVAVMAALAPYLLIVAAIAAVIAIIVLCVKHWDEIKEATKKAWDAIVNAVKVAVDWVINLIKSIIDWVKENWQGLLLLLVNPFAGAFKLIYDNCEGFKEIVDNAVKAIKEFFANLWKDIQNIFSSVGSWFSNKFKQAVEGVKNAFSSVKGFFSDIWSSIKQIFSNVGSTIGNAITNTVKKAVNSVLSTAVKIINGFISAINTAIGVINLIPGVNIGKLNKLNVPQLAKGGIIDTATLAVVGEQGKEAVVPLENNLEWLDKLADKLAVKLGGNTPIILTVDGMTLAKASVNNINKLTKQTGNLPLVLA